VEQSAAEDLAEDFGRVREGLRLLPPETLSAQDLVTSALMIEVCGDEIASLRAAWQRFTVAPLPEAGLASQILLFLPPAQLSDSTDLDLYVSTLAAVPSALAASSAELAIGRARGSLPVRHLVTRSIEQIQDYLDTPVTRDPFVSAAAQADVSGSEHALSAIRDLVTDSVRPAFAAYASRLRTEVWPTGRDDQHAGMSWLPEGEEIYRASAREYTTLDVDPLHLHKVGLELIRDLQGEAVEIGNELGWGLGFPALRDRMREDRSLYFADAAEMLGAATDAMRRAKAAVPTWIAEPPDALCEVREMSPLEMRNGVLGRYETAPLDRHRAGRYWLNTSSPERRPRYEIEALTFHESVPGHHVEVSKSQTVVLDSPFRQLVGVLPYREGWALYMERYASEVGLYTSPLMRLGMISFALWRACRLVVDTGLHLMRWTRDEAIACMWDNTVLTRRNVENEVDRYIAHPGSALGYMVGYLTIASMREQLVSDSSSPARNREFFSRLLAQGPLPLSLLSTTMNVPVEI
jgi:uncharacterized protein (DUF885 family)